MTLEWTSHWWQNLKEFTLDRLLCTKILILKTQIPLFAGTLQKTFEDFKKTTRVMLGELLEPTKPQKAVKHSLRNFTTTERSSDTLLRSHAWMNRFIPFFPMLKTGELNNLHRDPYFETSNLAAGYSMKSLEKFSKCPMHPVKSEQESCTLHAPSSARLPSFLQIL